MIIRKEYVKAAVGYSTGAPQIDATGRLVPQKAVYDVVCDRVADVVNDETLAVGTMAYFRYAQTADEDRRYIKVADNGAIEDWKPVDQVAAEEEAAL